MALTRHRFRVTQGEEISAAFAKRLDIASDLRQEAPMLLQIPAAGGRTVAKVVIVALALGTAALTDASLASDAAHAPHWLISWGLFATEFGTSAYMFAYSALIALVAIWGLRQGHRTWRGESLRLIAERAFYFFAAIAISGLLAQLIKHLVGRARPPLLAVDGPYHFEGIAFTNALASFPSGHTTSAFAAAVALSYMRPDWRNWLFGGAALIGLSRVLVGAHFPSDVVGGAVLGATVSAAVARSFARRGLAFTLRSGEVVASPSTR
jgi:membrane-associated phospholipid phosphatase